MAGRPERVGGLQCDITVLFLLFSASVGTKWFTLLLTGWRNKTRQIPLDDEKGANDFHLVVLWRRGKAANWVMSHRQHWEAVRSKNHLQLPFLDIFQITTLNNHNIKATSTYSYDCCVWISLKTLSSPQVLQLPPTIQRHAKKVWLSGYSKFSIGVSVSVNRCLSLYVSPVMNWQLIQGVAPPIAQCQQGLAPTPTVTLKGISCFGWMDASIHVDLVGQASSGKLQQTSYSLAWQLMSVLFLFASKCPFQCPSHSV